MRRGVAAGFSHASRILFFSLWTSTLVAIGVACAPSGPIRPEPARARDVGMQPEFDSEQRARLAPLHDVLAEPVSQALLGGLQIRLAFDEAADLDLFVTDPNHESVYFANSPTQSGGTLLQDRRCDDSSPRVETVRYVNPLPGRYRVGVDFHRRCSETPLSGREAKQGLFVVRVEGGTLDRVREGVVAPGRFEVIVLEFVLEEKASGGIFPERE